MIYYIIKNQIHYTKIKHKKIKGVSGTKASRGSPSLTYFTVPPSYNEFIIYWNQKNGYEPQKPPILGKTI